jgi:hypothetical protein
VKLRAFTGEAWCAVSPEDMSSGENDHRLLRLETVVQSCAGAGLIVSTALSSTSTGTADVNSFVEGAARVVSTMGASKASSVIALSVSVS